MLKRRAGTEASDAFVEAGLTTPGPVSLALQLPRKAPVIC